MQETGEMFEYQKNNFEGIYTFVKYGFAPGTKKNSPSAGIVVPSRLIELIPGSAISPCAAVGKAFTDASVKWISYG